MSKRGKYNGGTFVYDTSYGTFNLGLSNNMLLVEDGGVGNTAQEAKLTAKYIARVIAEYINRQWGIINYELWIMNLGENSPQGNFLLINFHI